VVTPSSPIRRFQALGVLFTQTLARHLVNALALPALGAVDLVP